MYGSVQSYDATLLRDLHCKQFEDKLFGHIDQLMSFRHFKFVADDGHLSADLGRSLSMKDAFAGGGGYPGHQANRR